MTDDASRVAAAAAAFREERADGERALEALLAVDAEQETWTFEDVPLSSGTFGEVVSRDIVENVDGEYRLAEPGVVRAVLEGEEVTPTADSGDDGGLALAERIAVDWHAAGALVGALVFLFAMRILNYRSVRRGEHVVSPANDPYYFRYWMEQLLAASDGVTDYGVITSMPDGIGDRRPLSHASNWFVAELLGGDQWAAEMVAAWLPVAATLVLGVLIYWLAVLVTDDVRVGLASVVLFALTPVHAVYTGVGFLDHNVHQYLWLGVTLVAFAWLATDLQRRRAGASTRDALRGHLLGPWTWLAALVLGVALAFSAHAWGGSVLMFVPAAAYVGLKVAMDAREGVSPVLANAPLLVGLGVAARLSAALHHRWGWHESFTAVVPIGVVVGAVVVVLLGELWRWRRWPTVVLATLEAVLAVVAIRLFQRVRPEEWARLQGRADALLLRERYTESVSLFTMDLGIIFGPLTQLGAGFYVALLVAFWACWVAYRRYEPGWLVLLTYIGFWLVAATIQVRFAGQLAIPLAVLGGLGLVALLAWVDLARVPVPFREGGQAGTLDHEDGDSGTVTADGGAGEAGTDEPSVVFPRDGQTVAYLVAIALLVCGASLIFVPTLSAQIVYDDAQYGAATAINDHAAATDREYPENYVLSHWPDNRMYNYLVSGEAESYGYADAQYEDFISSRDPDSRYGQFEGRVGYVVLTDVESAFSDRSAQVRLHERYGVGGENTQPLVHYRAVYLDDDATAFAVVPGATINGTAEPGERVTVGTTVEVTGETLSYERTVTAAGNGTFSATVPYPGTYDVGGEEVVVTETDVVEGRTVEIDR